MSQYELARACANLYCEVLGNHVDIERLRKGLLKHIDNVESKGWVIKRNVDHRYFYGDALWGPRQKGAMVYDDKDRAIQARDRLRTVYPLDKSIRLVRLV